MAFLVGGVRDFWEMHSEPGEMIGQRKRKIIISTANGPLLLGCNFGQTPADGECIFCQHLAQPIHSYNGSSGSLDSANFLDFPPNFKLITRTLLQGD